MAISFNELRRNLKYDFSGLQQVKVAVMSDSASQFLCQALKGYGFIHGIAFDIWEADYDQILQSVLDDQSGLYQHEPEYVVIIESSRKLQSRFYKISAQDREKFAQDHLEHISMITGKINKQLNTNIIWVNYAEIEDNIFGNFANKTSFSFLYQLRSLNLGLMDLAQKIKNLNICDLSSIQNQYGTDALYDERIYANTDNLITLDFLPSLAKRMTDIILSYNGRFRKCLVLDLDNTLWGGVIGDDGMEGIQVGDLGIGKVFTRFQQWILQLKERGIILAVCSKNTEAIAKEPFEKHPGMQIRLNDIALFVANWNNKVDNIRYIQSVLNIGFDSMVFFDDNPFEREMVKSDIPEIAVPDLPDDPAEYLSYLCTLNLFETASYTEDDSKRNEQYREEAGRIELQHNYANEDEFLQSLDMKAKVTRVNAFTLPRVAQLTQRSNQFNLRTVRYTEEEVKKIEEDKNATTICINLSDRFGDYGLISVGIARKEGEDTLFIDTWIMSCRVLKRGVEQLMLNELVSAAITMKCAYIEGEYIPTAKNGLVKDLYKNLGFSEGGRWRLELKNYTPREHFIQLAEKIN
jgi:FkbH-like protein